MVLDTRTTNRQHTKLVDMHDHHNSSTAESYLPQTSTNITSDDYYASKTSFFDTHLNIAMMSLIIAICGLGVFAVTTYLQLCHGRSRPICFPR